MSFIFTKSGQINLGQVDIINEDRTEKFSLQKDRKYLGDSVQDPGEVLQNLIPVSGEWECLIPGKDGNGQWALFSFPIIAWGLMHNGNVTPVTPFHLDGRFSDYGIRKVGSKTIWNEFAEYPDADAWLEEKSKNKE